MYSVNSEEERPFGEHKNKFVENRCCLRFVIIMYLTLRENYVSSRI